MKPLIGILLNRTILRRGVRGARTFERLPLYVKAATELNVDIVFFETAGVRTKRDEIVGYVPTGERKLSRKAVPLPKVVHKRGLFKSRPDLAIIDSLKKRDVYIFNSETPWDKFRIHHLLAENPDLLPYLPETVLPHNENFEWFRRQLHDGAEVFVKPKRGSLGLGIARIWRVGSGRYRYQSRRVRKKTSLRGVWNLVRKNKYTNLLQKGIPLMEDAGRRVDFRVPVQKDGTNRWHTAGIAAKRAEKLAFLTNLAQGASVHKGLDVLARNFGTDRAVQIADEMQNVARLAAETLNARHPYMVDLGMDLGVDHKGHPYLIEVNRRDLRVLLRQSGQPQAFETLYKNPIAYALYIHEQREGERRHELI